VTRVKSGLAERVEVTVGIEDPTSDRVEITSGLAEGDTVIIGSARGIQPGTRVRPSAPAERAGGGGGGGGGGGS
jgi:multidrug efflux pump subunit AcrA (membrane-fusion protein)